MLVVLDPRISYKHLKEDFANDATLLQDLEKAKLELHTYFHENYVSGNGTSTAPSGTGIHGEGRSNEAGASSSTTNFMARYRRREAQVVDELEEYFKLAPEEFETCNPFEWWRARRSNQVGRDLHRLALDILCIPGMFIFFPWERFAHLNFRISCSCRAHLFGWPRYHLPPPSKPQARCDSQPHGPQAPSFVET